MKQIVERVLAATVRSASAVRRMRGRCLVLAYHNVLPPRTKPSGERSLHMPWRSFVDQLDLLSALVDVIPLARLLGDAPRKSLRPMVAITFDDAYAGAVTHALPELAQRGMPATVFVAPGLLDGATFWWDRLADQAIGGVRGDVRTRALEDFAGRDEAVMTWAAREGLPINEPGVHSCGAAVEALDGASRLGGITFGAHSWSHPNLTRIGEAELESELRRPLAWLERYGERTVNALAYPYGAWNAATERAARSAGYRSTFRIEGGWIGRTADPMRALPRLDVSAGLSPTDFISGSLGSWPDDGGRKRSLRSGE